MAPMNRISKQSVRRTYLTGIALATGLFALHTWIIFEVAYLLGASAAEAVKLAGPHVAGPLLILACFLVLFITHLIEAAVWALFFWRIGEFASFSDAMYFAGTSLTTLGYGDIVLQGPCRSLGPIMANNGILIFGCSTAFLFFVIQKVWAVL
jgi:hypothetical protein